MTEKHDFIARWDKQEKGYYCAVCGVLKAEHGLFDKEKSGINRYSIGARGEKVFHEDGPHISYVDTQKVLEEIDLIAEAGLCQMSAGGKHAYLRDIRRIVSKLGIQGGLTSHD